MPLFGYQDCKQAVSLLNRLRLDLRAGSTWQYPTLPREGSWIPCELRTFRSYLKALVQVTPKYYEFYALSPLRRYQGIEERARWPRTTHNPLPTSPFCTHSIHQLVNTQALCTIWSKYTQYTVALNKYLCTSRSQQAWHGLRLTRCSRVWCLCGIFRFDAYGRLLWLVNTCNTLLYFQVGSVVSLWLHRTYSCPSIQTLEQADLLVHH